MNCYPSWSEWDLLFEEEKEAIEIWSMLKDFESTISGKQGSDAKKYQERQVEEIIRKVKDEEN